jgi:hypothetical protein
MGKHYFLRGEFMKMESGFSKICLFAVGAQMLSANQALAAAQGNDAALSIWGSVLAKGVLHDSARGNTPDFLPGEFNLGTKVSKGIGSATGKVWYSPVVSPTATVPKNFWVKQMNAALTFSNGIVFGLGRFDSTVKDLHVDAAKVAWSTKGTGTDAMDMAFYYGNTFEGSANFGGLSPSTQWRAYGLAANTRDGNWIAELRVGFEPHRAALAGADVWAAQEWQYGKMGFGYDITNIGAKIYGEFESLGGARKIATGGANHVAVTGEKISLASEMSTEMGGVEFWADSRFLGVSSIFAPEDRFTVGTLLEYREKKMGGIAQPSDTKWVAKGGYHTGQLAAWLELETHLSSSKSFSNSKGEMGRVSELLAINMEYVF